MYKLIISLIVCAFCFPGLTLACSCIGENTVQEEINKSDMIFTGKVLSNHIFIVSDNALPATFILKKAEYTILITKLYKGKVTSDTIKVVTGIGNGDCGYEFLIEKEYVFYTVNSKKYFGSGKDVPTFLYTDICSRTTLINKSEVSELNQHFKKKCNQ